MRPRGPRFEWRAARASWRTGLAVGLCVTVLGCTHTQQAVADPPPAPDAPDKLSAEESPAPAEPPKVDVVHRDLEPPATLKTALVQPWSDEALELAGKSLDNAIKSFPVPADLAKGIKRLDGNRRPAPATGAMVRRYLEARDAYYQRDFNTALRLIDQVIAADRHAAEPHVLRGRVMLDAVGAEAARRSFSAALECDPDHPQALFFEGQLAFNAREYKNAAVLIHRLLAIDPTEQRVDKGLQYIARYYLGQALLREGYDAAAVESLVPYVQKKAGFAGITSLGRRADAVGRQRGPTLLQLGDALLRLGRISEAIEHYQQASTTDRIDESAINSRKVYALLLLDESELAEQAAIKELSHDGARSDSLMLVEYVAEQSDDRARFAKALRKVYDAGNDGELLARAIVRTLDDDAAIEKFIAADIARHPRHTALFDDLLGRLGDDQLGRAVLMTLGMIETAPSRAEVFVERLLDRPKVTQDQWVGAFDALPADRRDSVAGHYLRAGIDLRDNDAEAAMASLDRALKADPAFGPAIVSKVRLTIRLGELNAALKLIEAHDDDEVAGLKFLRVAVLDGMAQRAKQTNNAAAADRYHEQAKALLDELITGAPTDVELLLMRSTMQRRVEDFAGAETTLLRLLSIDSTYEPAYEALFRIYENEARDPQKFVQLITRARIAVPNARVTRLKLAQVHRIRGQYNNAEELLRDLVVEDSRDAAAMRELVSLLVSTRRSDEAHGLLLKVLDDDPESIAALLLLEELAGQRGDLEPFRQRYEVYLGRLRDGAGKQLRLAQLYAQWGKPLKQIAALQAALGHDPEDASPIHRQLAAVYSRQKRHDEAVREAQRAVELKPAETAAHATLAHVLYEADRGDTALQVFADAITAGRADSAELSIGRSELLFRMGRVDDAIDELDRAIELSPDDRQIELLYRKAGYAHEDPRRAEQLLKQILQKQPNHAGANNDLGYRWADEGRHLARAERMIRIAVSAKPNQPAYLDSLGWVLYKKGEFAQARAWLQRAANLPGGKDATIIDHLGDALWRIGSTDAAIEKWSAALDQLKQTDADDLRSHEKQLIESLGGKLKAARAGDEPPIAPVPTPEPAPEPSTPPDEPVEAMPSPSIR